MARMGVNYVNGLPEAQKRRRRARMLGIIWLLLGFPIIFVGDYCIVSTFFKFFVTGRNQNFGCLIFNYAVVGQCYMLMRVYVTWRNAPSFSIGRSAKFSLDVVTLCIALILRHFVEYRRRGLLSLVSQTTKLHTYWQLMYAFCDFGFWDVLLQVSMQSVVFLSGDDPLVYTVVLMSCGAIILYRYFLYSAPLQPEDCLSKNGEVDIESLTDRRNKYLLDSGFDGPFDPLGILKKTMVAKEFATSRIAECKF